MKGVRLMTQLPTWVNEMQSKALAAMPSLKLPKAIVQILKTGPSMSLRHKLQFHIKRMKFQQQFRT